MRRRALSGASAETGFSDRQQELGSMYDYLAKVVLLGPSGCGKSCLLHRFVREEWRTLSSQTIGVELSSKILRIGTGPRRKRIKFQLWDTAGTERFRSVSRSYYRGAAGALLVYDVSSRKSLEDCRPFLHDLRALSASGVCIVAVGNKSDIGSPHDQLDIDTSSARSIHAGLGAQHSATIKPDGREVRPEDASRWAAKNQLGAMLEASALTGEGVEEAFMKLARMILTKIELGEVNPEEVGSGIQYGDLTWDATGTGSDRRRQKRGPAGLDLRSGISTITGGCC